MHLATVENRLSDDALSATRTHSESISVNEKRGCRLVIDTFGSVGGSGELGSEEIIVSVRARGCGGVECNSVGTRCVQTQHQQPPVASIR